ncbi:DeoR/GlpR family DNA-binding transcription regulator [Bacillus massiliigorillae]|uniref:DeoR/GlpR family DNA-binding transcription regulator n=1 Tax=Bacillus massiliigorillae TaxID=1243664 RepID=UPI0003A7902C|nr:DeoR/GlpR family DNA-binding transcription regulator [Bacillus massiliigorillae]
MSVAGEERKKRILEILDVEGKVKVNDLASKLGVSTETIRRYLEELDKEEKLKKVYGGAVKVSYFKSEPSAVEREIIRIDEKEKIGKEAVSIINDHDVIAIDDGSTTMQLAKHLVNKTNITVLTNSVTALSALIENHYQQLFTGKIIFIGGEINSTHYRTTGSISLKMIEDYYVDKYFITVDGISLERGVTCYDSSKGIFTKKMIQQAYNSIILIDHTKIDQEKYFRIGELEDIDTIICDQPAPDNWSEAIKKSNINWIVPESENN